MQNDRLIEIFFDLIRINALSREEKPVADYITGFLRNLGFNPVTDESYKFTGSNTGNIICKIGTGGNYLMLSHMDTARPTAEVKPIISDDKISSDTTTVLGVDNRAGIAVLLYSIEKAVKEGRKLNDFTLAFTTCEETTLEGSLNLGINGGIKSGYIFDSSHRPGKFIYSSCGAMSFKVYITGKASHSGIAPEKGINAIACAADAVSKIQQGRIDHETTVNIGKFTGGSAVNVVSESVYLEGEVRSFNIPKIDVLINEIKGKFESSAAGYGASVKFEPFWDFKPFTLSQEDEVFVKTMKMLEEINLKPEPVISLGGSDANSLNGRGIKSVNLGIGAQNPHGNDEFIFLEDLQKSSELAMKLMTVN
ncbi:MAG: M20/M25/M40 family metallo-hydrolase [Ignavibacteriaceae bacterium]|nr:M20/M25/M40 family metallo-hydrolase [Ignavibacteriaceae bacterium]